MEVFNRNELVGTLTQAVPDMWYLEGRFTAAPTPAGTRFQEAASGLNAGLAYANPSLGIRAYLREPSEAVESMFIVMSLSEGQLFGRRVFDSEAIEWATANVSE